MAQYILIKKYPGSPILGTKLIPKVDLENENTNNFYWEGSWFNPKDFPEYWEKVVEKDYEILEIKGKYGAISSYIEKLDHNLKDKTIFKIKRLSDNLIFTVGDDVLSKTCGVPNKILSIEIINNKIRLYPRNSFYNLEDIIKIKKQPIFKTEDGVDIFEEDEYFFFHTEVNSGLKSGNPYEIMHSSHRGVINLNNKYIKRFSTKEKAEEYIKLNKIMFKTVKGENIYEGDSFYYLHSNDFLIKKWNNNTMQTLRNNMDFLKDKLMFLTKEDVNEYVLFNKPCLSINSIKQTMKDHFLKIDIFIEIAKTKI